MKKNKVLNKYEVSMLCYIHTYFLQLFITFLFRLPICYPDFGCYHDPNFHIKSVFRAYVYGWNEFANIFDICDLQKVSSNDRYLFKY